MEQRYKEKIMKPILIILTGRKQTGKDTLGDYLRENHFYAQYAFGDRLKEITANFVNFLVGNRTGEEHIKPHDFNSLDFKKAKVNTSILLDEPIISNTLDNRDLLIAMGAGDGIMEKLNPLYFVDYVISPLKRFHFSDAIITDARLLPEIERTKEKLKNIYNIVIVKLNSIDEDKQDVAITDSLDYQQADHYILNDKTLGKEHFHQQIENLILTINNK